MTFTILFTLLAAVGPASANDVVPVYLSKAAGISSLSEATSALARALPDTWEVKVNDGKKRQVKTCRDFLDVIHLRFELDNPVDWPVWWQQGALCFALSALEKAKPASRSYLGWFRISKQGIGKLPPGLAMLDSPDDEDEAAAAAKACRGWRQFDPSLSVRAKGSDEASLRSDGWTGRLVLYARADIDGDGLEDLLLRRDAHATGGSAAESEVFVITQLSASGCAKVVRSMGAPDTRDLP